MRPKRAPNANAHAERFVRSIKHECLDRIVPPGERHFRRVLAEFVDHYHRERNHQGLENPLIEARAPDEALPTALAGYMDLIETGHREVLKID
jgi:putative transposase